MMRWWWFGPAVTKPELEREDASDEKGGIADSKCNRVPAYSDDPDKGIEFSVSVGRLHRRAAIRIRKVARVGFADGPHAGHGCPLATAGFD